MKYAHSEILPYGQNSNSTYCGGIGGRLPYLQLFHVHPHLKWFYLNLEENYDALPVQKYMIDDNYMIPIVSIILYGLFCFWGSRIMANRKPFDLKVPLAVWNLLLSLFSAYGALRTLPHLIHRINTYTFEETICEHVYSAYGCGSVGLAVMLFIWSKIPELLDTVFIVLRKKPLIFLHWYHHISVLLFCWNAYVTESSAGLYFVAMNYTVHTVMYFYYFLQTIKLMPKWFPSWIITLMQICQMIVGTMIVCASFYYYYMGGEKYQAGECNNDPSNLAVGGMIYASYLCLFVEFASKRFCVVPSTCDLHLKTENHLKIEDDNIINSEDNKEPDKLLCTVGAKSRRSNKKRR